MSEVSGTEEPAAPGEVDMPEVVKDMQEDKDAFQLEGQPLGRTQLIQHEIHTSRLPIRQPPWRFPIGLREEGEKQIEEMIEKDVIELSLSPWASPVVLVKKKDGTYRVCFDYRKLNRQLSFTED